MIVPAAVAVIVPEKLMILGHMPLYGFGDAVAVGKVTAGAMLGDWHTIASSATTNASAVGLFTIEHLSSDKRQSTVGHSWALASSEAGLSAGASRACALHIELSSVAKTGRDERAFGAGASFRLVSGVDDMITKSFKSRAAFVLASLCAALSQGTPALGVPTNATQPIPAPIAMQSPTNLRQPMNSADCLKHVAGGGQGYYEHVAFGCSHPTAGYVTLIWDWAGGEVSGFHVWRVDNGRQDYGVHSDGTVAFIHSSGYACFVVTAVQGSGQSRDSNRYCVVPMAKPIQQLNVHPVTPAPTATSGKR